MSTPSSNEQDAVNLTGDWEKIGGYFSLALGEIATSLGGQDLAARITESAKMPDTAWPDPAALKSLDDLYPGSVEQVMARSKAIQAETHERELAELNKLSIRSYGKLSLQSFGVFRLFGTPPRKK